MPCYMAVGRLKEGYPADQYNAYEITHHLKAAKVRMVIAEPDLLPVVDNHSSI